VVTAVEREQSRKDGTFGSVRPVRVEKKVQHVDCRLRIVEQQKF